MTLNQAVLHTKGPQSPHKLMTRGKFRKQEEEKNNAPNLMDQRMERQFSPINKDKTIGVRIGIKTNSIDLTESQQPLQGFGDFEQEDQTFEGQCFLKTKTDRYKEHWAVLAGNELFCYRQKGDTEPRVMHSIIGTFIKEMDSEDSQSEGCTLYPVKIALPPNKSRILYFKQQSQQKDWFEKINAKVGFSNLFDFYTFESNLGKGQFGLVKLATHIKTGKKVAIKTVNKKDMKPIEIYQQRREIDVLKMSQHPNIVALIDLFENSEYYYIVLEYMQGKDLFDYI